MPGNNVDQRNKRITHDLVREENIKVYRAEAPLYDVLHPEIWNWYEQRRCERLVDETLKRINNGNHKPLIVDVGAGTGNLTLKYLGRGCRTLSIDISREMMQILDKKVPVDERSRCTIRCADVESALREMPEFDGVCFGSVLHHLFDFQGVMKSFVERLKPGGFFFAMHPPLVRNPQVSGRLPTPPHCGKNR